MNGIVGQLTPRWDRVAVETGVFIRMWNTILGQKLPHRRFIDLTDNSMKLRVPKYIEPEMEFEWRIPDVWNAFERNRGRAYAVAYQALVAYDNWLKGMDLLKKGGFPHLYAVYRPQEPSHGSRFLGRRAGLADTPSGDGQGSDCKLSDCNSLYPVL